MEKTHDVLEMDVKTFFSTERRGMYKVLKKTKGDNADFQMESMIWGHCALACHTDDPEGYCLSLIQNGLPR